MRYPSPVVAPALVVIAILASLAGPLHAQTAHTAPTSPATQTEATAPPSDPADAPPFLGQVIVQPPSSGRVEGDLINKHLRPYGLELFDISQDLTFSYNLLSPPVPLAQQTYNGQRPTFTTSHYPALTWDLRQLHVRGGQLVVEGAIQRNSWYPGGPEATGFGQVSYYQSLFHGKVEVKGGYIDNDGEFVGLFVGGLASNGALGVYAVLPFEVGMSYLPLTAPALNTTFHTPDYTYSKVGFQRSFDPGGGAEEVKRDSLGLRFSPKGDGLLMIYEGGYKHDPAPDTKQTWARVGYMYNDTHYTSAKPLPATAPPNAPPLKTGNNQAVYGLVDRQFVKTSVEHPGNGIFGGVSAEYAPPAQNAYTAYYEARLYDNGPFRSRPSDFASLVASRTGYSRYVTDAYVRSGKSVWRAADAVTASYTVKLFRGAFLANGLSYTNGPAITPRSHNSLTITTELTTFF
jgi:porin